MSTGTIQDFRMSPQQKRLWLLQQRGRAYVSRRVAAVEQLAAEQDGHSAPEAIRSAGRGDKSVEELFAQPDQRPRAAPKTHFREANSL
jgi:hypothetical protein